MRRFIVEISSRDHGGWEIPRAAICKLKNQESWWHNSVWVWTPRFRGADGVNPSPKARDQEHWCLRAEKDGCHRSSREIKFTLPLTHSIEAFNGLDALFTPHWCWQPSLLSLSIQCWSLPEISSQIHTQIMFYQLTGHPLAWSSWQIKLTWQFSYIVMKGIRQLFVFNYHK